MTVSASVADERGSGSEVIGVSSPESSAAEAQQWTAKNVATVVVQVIAGIAIGGCADVLLYLASFQALVALHWTVLADAFEGTYTHPERDMTMDVLVYALLIAAFVALRRIKKLKVFATTGLVAHCIIGSLWTLIVFCFRD